MELLLLLVAERGQLVTRDRIIERVWGKDVFLDTDNSINAAVRKVRQVLKTIRNGRTSCAATGRGIASSLRWRRLGRRPSSRLS